MMKAATWHYEGRLRWALLLLLPLGLVFCGKSKGDSDEKQVPGYEEWTKFLAPGQIGNAKTPAEALKALVQNRKEPSRLLRPSKRAKKAVGRRADALLKTGYVHRKNPPLKLEPPIDWARNPGNDRRWHIAVNALKPVGPLIRAYEGTMDPKYLSAARGLVLDWIDFNLVKKKSNRVKWNPLGVGLRSRWLSVILDQEIRSKKPDLAALGRLVWAADEHIRFLSDPHNLPEGKHGVQLLKGLRWLLEALPEIKERERYFRYAGQRMKLYVQSEFNSEGFQLEHSPTRHLFATKVFARVEESGLFSDLPGLKKAVDLARSHTEEFRHPNGDVVLIGEGNRGGKRGKTKGKKKASKKGDKKTKKARKPKPAMTKKKALPLAKKPEPGPPDEDALRPYWKVGYAAFRSHWGKQRHPSDDYLFFAPGHHSAVHKHADHFSFEWSLRGQPILIDSGRFSLRGGTWRQFFTSTRAGNAVEVDDKDYSVETNKSIPALRAAGEVGGLYFAEAERQHPEVGVEQTRLMVWKDGQYLLVVDLMKALKSPQGKDESDPKKKDVKPELHTYRQWFHFHEALEPVLTNDVLSVALPGDTGTLYVSEINATEPEQLDLARGQKKPRIVGYVSPSEKKKLKRSSLSITRKAENASFFTLFSLGRAVAPSVKEKDGKIAVRFRTARGKAEGFVYTPGEKTPISALK